MPLKNFVRRRISSRQIANINSLYFDSENLTDIEVLNIDHILSNSAIADNWDSDHSEIKALYGNDDKIGGVNPGDRKALYFLIAGLKPKAILEVGTHIGASTLHMACALKRNGDNGLITSVDIADVNHPEYGAWKSVGLSACPKDFATALECSDLIEFHTGPCQNYMKQTDKRYDFIFLDGDHCAEAVYKEVHAALLVLNKGGALLLHDYYPDGKALFPDGSVISGPYMALERIKRENSAIDVASLTPLPWETKQGSNNTSLALVIKK